MSILKFLESAFIGDAFNTRIKVEFINHADNSIIDIAEFEQQYLPEDFTSPLSVFIDGREWKIIRAIPGYAAQYSLDKKLILWVYDPWNIGIINQTQGLAEKKISFGPPSDRP